MLLRDARSVIPKGNDLEILFHAQVDLHSRSGCIFEDIIEEVVEYLGQVHRIGPDRGGVFKVKENHQVLLSSPHTHDYVAED